MADQPDYVRISYPAGLAAPPGLSYQQRYGCWLIPRWDLVPPRDTPDFTTAVLPVRVAVLLRRILFTGSTFDIRWAAGVHLALLCSLILVILKKARTLPMAAYLAIALGMVAVCTDSAYLAYFNSLYSETAALLGVFAFLGAGLAAVITDEPSRPHMAALVAASAFLTGK